MKAVIIKGKRDLEVKDLDVPKIKAGEVLVKVKASGICGTDVHVYEDEVPLAKLPVVPGHEFSGIIEKVGEQINDFTEGDRIAIEPNLFCGHCHFCRNAKKHFCENWGAIGLTQNGGFEEFVAVPRQALYRMENNLSFTVGAFFEPTACVLHGIERSGAKPGDTVVVLGTGSIGLIYIQLLKFMGIKNVIASDIDSEKLAIAKELGANVTINPLEEKLVPRVKEQTDGFGADVVIDAAGVEQTLTQTFDLVQDTGTIVIFGVPPEKLKLPVKMFDIYRRELTIVGSFTNPYTNEQALKILSTGKIKFDKILTHKISLDDVEETIINIREKKEKVIKAQITF
ncbi:MAG: zinc-dependent alcohol dehydrogenase family protein [Promethearchaeota archaeon]